MKPWCKIIIYFLCIQGWPPVSSILQSLALLGMVASCTYSGDKPPPIVPVSVTAEADSQGFQEHPPSIVWTRNFGGPSYEEARSVIETAEGGLIAAGWSHVKGKGEDVYVVKTDKDGNLQWSRRYGTEEHERAYAIRETSNGFVIAGRTRDDDTPAMERMLLMKITKSGDHQWTKLFGDDRASGARDLQMTSDGGFVLAGWTGTQRHSNSADMYIVKTDRDGTVEWERRYRPAHWQGAHSILQNADGGYIVSGLERPSADAPLSGYIIRTDASGNLLWDRTDGGIHWDEWHGVAHAPDAGFVFSGGSRVQKKRPLYAWIMKTTEDGRMVWQHNFERHFAYSWTIVPDRDGGYVFAGKSADRDDGYVVKISESGEYRWGIRLGSNPDGNRYVDGLRSVVVTSDGGYVLAGYFGKEHGRRPTSKVQPDWDRDVWLIKLQRDGATAR